MVASILTQTRGYKCTLTRSLHVLVRNPHGATYCVDLAATPPRCSCPWGMCRKSADRPCKHIAMALAKSERVTVPTDSRPARRRAFRLAAWFRADAAPKPVKAAPIPYVNGIYWHPLTDPATDGRVRTAEAQARAERVYARIGRDFPL